MIRFSCADYTFPALTRFQALKVLRVLAFDFVDIGLFARSDHYSPAQLMQSGEVYIKQVRSELEAAELCVGDVFLQIGLDPSQCAVNAPNRLVRNENRMTFDRALEFCAAVGSCHLTGLPGVFHPNSDSHQDLALATEETSWRVDRCDAAGVQYSIEPHIGSICPDIESAKSFINGVRGLTLTLDYGHFVYSGHTSEQVHGLLPATSHLHLRGGARGRMQTSVQESTIDFVGVLRQLRRRRYQGLMALEYVHLDWENCNRVDNIAETIMLRRMLEAAIREMDKE
jgi:sugar phosphate isomerase/epimerase